MDEHQHNEEAPSSNGEATPPQLGRAAQLKSAQTLVTVGIIGGPVSMLFGSTLISLIALICSAIAYMKVRGTISSEQPADSLTRAIQRQALVALVVSGVSLVFNIVYLIIMMPTIIEAVESGDFAKMFDFGGMSGQDAAPADSSSIWG